MIYFTADTHFRHANSIKYSNRPFKTIEEMDEALIKNWNSVVAKNDIVYHLGDFAFKDIEMIRKQLNGNIVLIRGNHDKKIPKGLFANVYDIHEVNYEGKSIILCHYCMVAWNKSHFGSWHLFGHSHGSIEGFGKCHDVGVDVNSYTPVSIEGIKKIMEAKENNFNLIE